MEEKQVFVRVSAELHKQLRVWAALNEMSMSQAAALAIEKMLAEKEANQDDKRTT